MLLEMLERPLLTYTRPARSGMLLRLDEPSIDFYTYLLEHAGTASARERWIDAAEEELFEYLSQDEVEVFVLFIGGAPAGFFELCRRGDDEVELVCSGLVPEFQARGLGKYVVATAVETAWDHQPVRVWVSADGDEDPRGLLLYQWAGFVAIEIMDGDEEE